MAKPLTKRAQSLTNILIACGSGRQGAEILGYAIDKAFGARPLEETELMLMLARYFFSDMGGPRAEPQGKMGAIARDMMLNANKTPSPVQVAFTVEKI